MSDGGDGRGSEGRLVGGRYRLIERIGSGGMGTVWRALDERVEREVAVKEPRLPGGPGDESHRRAAHRLYREARAAARVDHPAAVSIHDVVVEEPGLQGTTGPDGSPAPPGPDGLPWIVMELVRGESLHDRLRRGPLPAAEAAGIGRAVLGALRAAHAVGIVHRDVKPANVLLGPHGRVVLTDFGIAHVQGEESLTVSGEFVGSLEFVAPERMSGRIAGPASDLWSLGVLLYAAVEGWSPFRRTTLESTLAAVLAADPPEPVNAGPLGPLIVGLLAKEPGQRPSAEEVAKGLDGATEEWPAPEPGPAEPQRPDEMPDSAHDTGTVRLTPESTHPGPDAEARSEDTRPHATGTAERPSDAVAVRDGGSAADVAPFRDGDSPLDVAPLRDGNLPPDAAAPEKPGAAAGPSPEGRRPARTGAGLPPQAPHRRPVAPAQQPGPAPAAAEAPRIALPPAAAEAPRTAPAPVAAEAPRTAPVAAAAEESRTASVPAAVEGSRTAPAPVAAEAPRTAPAPAEESRTAPAPAEAPRTASVPVVPRRRRGRTASLVLIGAGLLVGAVVSVAFLLDGGDGGDGGTVTDGSVRTTPSATAAASSARPAPAADAWVAHREKDMDAVLSLPGEYLEFAREGGPDDQPRIAVYEDGDGSVQVRLTQWDRAPRAPMAQAQEAHRGWDGYMGDARTQYTPTGLQGYEAVLADTTYGHDGSPTRVMELIVLTDDSRMYELRVDMPKGTPDEKKGTEVFKGARDRLRIGKN
ncbi:hypothetical protein GCM10010377_38820 [Streptomyces viridiviolaceus]|uniref:non-specific serine/threonine protein kinase n=1 Tax=Streptomyces viridiviolaceus TaxID=68282 RepID=A0ABW2DZF5_9ACTN|nr:hypothetical protein GCM10010377_38820 [Streptomyces viridiviolaceus]